MNIDKAIEKIEKDNYLHFSRKCRHYGKTCYEFYDSDYLLHWKTCWYVREVAKRIEEEEKYESTK